MGGGRNRRAGDLFHASHVSCVRLRCCCHRELLLLDLRVELPDNVFDHFLFVLSDLKGEKKTTHDCCKFEMVGKELHLLAGAFNFIDFFDNPHLPKA